MEIYNTKNRFKDLENLLRINPQVGKKPKADLIFVYNDSHLKELKKIKAVYDILSDEKKKEEEDKGGFIFSNKTVNKEETEKDLEKEVLENEKLELDDTDIVWDDI